METNYITNLISHKPNTQTYEDIIAMQESAQTGHTQTTKKPKKTHPSTKEEEEDEAENVPSSSGPRSEKEDGKEQDKEDEYENEELRIKNINKISKTLNIEKNVVESLDKETLKSLRSDADYDKSENQINEEDILNRVPRDLFCLDSIEMAMEDEESEDELDHPEIDRISLPPDERVGMLTLNRKGRWSVDLDEVRTKWSPEQQEDYDKYRCQSNDVCLLRRLFNNPLSMRSLILPQLATLKHEVSDQQYWIFYYYMELATKVNDPLYVLVCQLFLLIVNSRSQYMFMKASHEPSLRSFLSLLSWQFNELCRMCFEKRNIISILTRFVEPLRKSVQYGTVIPGAHAAPIHTIKSYSAFYTTNVNPHNIIPNVYVAPEQYLPFVNSHICPPLLSPRMKWENEKFLKEYMRRCNVPVKEIVWPEDPLYVNPTNPKAAVNPIDLLVDFKKFKWFIEPAGFLYFCRIYAQDGGMTKGKNSKKNKIFQFEMPCSSSSS